MCICIQYANTFLCVLYFNRTPAEEKFLPMLLFILIHGNVSIYQWKHGMPPPEKDTTGQFAEVTQSETNDESLEIDWGGSGDAATIPGSEPALVSSQSDGIEFGIDFGDSEIDLGTDETVELSCITVEETGENLETPDSHPLGWSVLIVFFQCLMICMYVCMY